MQAGSELWSDISAGFTWLADTIGSALNSIGINLQTVGNFVTNLAIRSKPICSCWNSDLRIGRNLEQLAFTSLELGIVTWYNRTVYLLTVAMPQYLAWFGQNWKEILTDIVNFYINVGSNMWHNPTIWEGIKGIFKGHGTGDFKFVSLTQGFESYQGAATYCPTEYRPG